MRRSVGLLEVFGLRPLGPALRQSWTAIAGDGTSPPSQFGLSSVKMFRPLRVSFPLWLGRERADGRVWIYNLFNRRPIPREQGYSVKITTCRDFRGGQLTYDGHVGTDFAVPVGTEVRTIAAGIVRSVQCDMQRGGLKVVMDHGGGLMSTSNHLARALVAVGDHVERGGVLGLSGMSSVDGVLFFPWLAPHLHLNVLLNGEPVDPFAKEGEVSLWRRGNDPGPADAESEPPLEPTRWDAGAVEAGIAACNDRELKAELLGAGDLAARACALVVARLFRYHAFDAHPPLVAEPHSRTAVLDLPFRDYRGVAFADE